MLDLAKKTVLVIGINSRAQAVCSLLSRLGARAVIADSPEAVETVGVSQALRAQGATVVAGAS
jgi:UDP-N-acetylmuramoylalanine-D-glutamate ligase